MLNTPQGGENPSALAVLVVDDEPLIRWSLRDALRRRGHQVTEAGNAAEALRALTSGSERFDVVILDYRLPDRQDLTLLSDVRRLAPRATVCMMTAFGDESMRAEAFALGARAVVEKPFQVNAVVTLVESGLSVTGHSNA
jgi:DNA-binding NtrC family response regulator